MTVTLRRVVFGQRCVAPKSFVLDERKVLHVPPDQKFGLVRL